MKKILLCFLLLSLAGFSEENEKTPSNKENVSPPTKKIKPHFAGVRRGSSNKLKRRLAHLSKLNKEVPEEKQNQATR